jgi:hypothetical protein
MMHFRKFLLMTASACLLATVPAWGQNASVVYVATGGPEIYAVSAGGAATALIPTTDSHYNSGAAFESLAVGPNNLDNVSQSSFFLYGCDPTGNQIVRLQLDASSPGAAATSIDTVYDGTTSLLTSPVCGRVASNGDLYVSSAQAGSGVYVIHDASTDSEGSFNPPTSVYDSTSLLGGAFVGGGIAQKNVGDMLVVDRAGGRIWRAAFTGANSSAPAATSPFAPTLSNYVSSASVLSSPVGIARISTGVFFVVNQGSLGNVEKFNPSDLSHPSVCVGTPSGNVTLTSVATSEDNYLYVGVASPSQNKREVQVVNGSDCSAVTTISLSAVDSPLGIAVPPVPASVSASATNNSGNRVNTYNFGSSVFQTTTNNCTPEVDQRQVSASFLNELLAGIPTDAMWPGGTAVPYNGEGGFGTLYTVTAPNGCSPAEVQTNLLIGSLYDTTQFTNPRIISCETESDCSVIEASGTWPVGGFIPTDPSSGGRIPGFSEFFMANGTLSGELGTFCGFDSPLSSTDDPATAVVFNSGQNLSVKFKLALGAAGTGDCSNGPYITDAQALLSVARVADGQAKAVFEPITINSSGKSTTEPPTFKFNKNSQQYQFSLSLKGDKPGLYSLTVTFLTNNAPYVTTYFKIQ